LNNIDRDSTNKEEERMLAVIELQQRILACRRCQEQGYLQHAHPIVSGRATDRVMVIGQAPGHRSVAQKRPFSGPGGRVLQKWLEQVGFPPGYLHQHCYLTSLTHCDPGKNPSGEGDRRPSAQEVALCRPFLLQELRLVQPKVVLLLGSMAIEAFFGKVRLQDVIGTYREQDGTLLLPLPHPSGVSRWLNDPQHQRLHQQALTLLAHWRKLYEL
jgi:uracil-DNA glycosylase family 4